MSGATGKIGTGGTGAARPSSSLRRRVLPVLVAWLVPLLVAACGGEGDPVSGRDFSDLPADQVMIGLDTDIKDMGVLRARLHADTAHQWEDSARTLMFPVDLKLYGENGGETGHLTAREGELESRTNRMVARGNVVLVTSDGRRIETEELHYDPQSHRIWSDVRTVLIEGDQRIEGTGFRSDDQMQNLEVFGSTGQNIEIEF